MTMIAKVLAFPTGDISPVTANVASSGAWFVRSTGVNEGSSVVFSYGNRRIRIWADLKV